MKVVVQIDKIDALKLGKNYTGQHVITFDPADLSAVQRDVLATKCAMTGSGPPADFYLVYGPGPTTLTEPTLEALQQLLNKSAAVIEQSRLYQEERRREVEAGEKAAIARLLASPVDTLLERSGSRWEMVTALRCRQEVPELAALVVAVQEAIDKADADDAKAREEHEVARLRGQETLRQWALSWGSELLQARIRGGYEWIGLAYTEFADAQLQGVELDSATAPDGYGFEGQSPRATPTLAEIKTLEGLKKRLPSAKLRLVRTHYVPDDDTLDADPEAEGVFRTEIAVEVPLPDGSTYTTEYLV